MEHKALQLVENIVSQLDTSSQHNVATKAIKLFYKNNPDGTIRWVWPAGIESPVFLKFYNTATRRAQYIASSIKAAFNLGLQKQFADGSITAEIRHNVLSVLGDSWAIFAGTPGATQTALVYSGNNKSFYKLPIGPMAAQAMQNEAAQMRLANSLELYHTDVPVFSIEGKAMQMEDISGYGNRAATLQPAHWKTLAELAAETAKEVKIKDTEFWQVCTTKIEKLISSTDKRLPRGLVLKLIDTFNRIDEDQTIPVCLAHGDFTPWNMYVSDGGIMLYDWEMADGAMPMLFDAFHFIYQQETLASGIENPAIDSIIKLAFNNNLCRFITGKYNIDITLHHKLYLIYSIAKFISQYLDQENWQVQIEKSIQVWNISLNNYSQSYSARQKFILDMFTYVNNKQYAALKWFDTTPEYLDELADIDLCLSKADAIQLVNYVKAHPLAAKVVIKTKSYIVQLYITLNNGEYVCIDCISSFKRKNVVMLDAADVLNDTVYNNSGVKIPALQYDFMYTWMFYTINGTSIPAKYQEYFIQFGKLLNEKLHSLIPNVDYKTLLNYSTENLALAKQLTDINNSNKGINGIANKLHYIVDAAKEFQFGRGFIITFSGVDGAGKSTVIEKLRTNLEKKYRRKVVVLRHRPALLPMLSAWREGSREAAELKAANTLPRQGKNKSILSSLARFIYYYSDYFFGQFYIYVKYVLRGNIVLFDRYYFDFINDSKRSNIELHPSITQIGYTFLIKPRYNFFLYANEEVIVQRKQELDIETIKSLTQKYLQLFEKLSKKTGKNIYVAIENIKLGNTLSIIDNHVKSNVL